MEFCHAGFDNTQAPTTECQQTVANFYSPANDKTRTACPTPGNSSPTAAMGSSNPQGCFDCNAGYWRNPQGSGSCDVPDLGKWVDATNNSKKDCTPITPNSNFNTWLAGAAAADDACPFSCSGAFSVHTSTRTCVATTQSCSSVPNGSGTQNWETPNNRYGTCTITDCDAGFDNDQDSTQCQATAATYYSPANDKTRTTCPMPSNSSPTTTTGLSSVDGCFTCSNGYFVKAGACEKIEPDAFALGEKTSYVLYNSGEVEGWGSVSSDPWVFNRKIDLGTVSGTKNKAQAIESRFNHRCVILKNGTNDHGAVKCWGVNTYGQLGIVGDTTDRDTPTDITALGNDASSNPYTAKSLAVGNEHVCAILNDDKVKCWGRNNFGQIGGGSGSDITVSGTLGDPLRGATATAVTAYNYTCAILNNGKVKCWGNNAMGSTDGGTPNLGNGRTATALAAGAGYSCALKDDQSIGCWGWKGNTIIQGFLLVPVKERFSPFTDTATQIGTGLHSFCAILTDKTVKCFVDNVRLHYGDIGGSATNRSANRAVVRGTTGDPLEGETAVSVAMGVFHTCALTETDKSIKCFGKKRQRADYRYP